jgi:23S rRNA pseudouridine1911/1915/1917 synthase
VRKGTLVNALLARFPELRGVGEADRPGIVHRLDKETSGVMVVARNEKALRSLQAQFKSRQVRKTYLALVWGKMPAREGKLDRPIGRHVSHGQRMSVRTRRPRTAETQYAVLEVLPETSFLEVRPLTGRTHQIRVHMAAAGHPVVGDVLYGKRKGEKRAGRMFLHAHKLSFLHPASGERVEFVSLLPADLEAVRTAFSGQPFTIKRDSV